MPLLPPSPDSPQQPGEPAANKPQRGRPKGSVRDPKVNEWLDHLRKWAEELAPVAGVNWDRVSVPRAEQQANIRPSYLTRWHSRATSHGVETKLNREEYVRLAALLKAWYGYEPPADVPTI